MIDFRKRRERERRRRVRERTFDPFTNLIFHAKEKKNACNYSVEEKKKKKDSSGTPVSAINQINKKLLN